MTKNNLSKNERTYLLCVGIALMNVVVAVLLEKMVGDDEDDHRDFKGQIREDRLPEHLDAWPRSCLRA